MVQVPRAALAGPAETGRQPPLRAGPVNALRIDGTGRGGAARARRIGQWPPAFATFVKGKTMTRVTVPALALALAICAAPFAAQATPAVGDEVGTTPETATAALKAKGCTVKEFEAEDGKIEAKCSDDASGKALEVYIDPASGKVVEVKGEE